MWSVQKLCYNCNLLQCLIFQSFSLLLHGACIELEGTSLNRLFIRVNVFFSNRSASDMDSSTSLRELEALTNYILGADDQHVLFGK